METLNLKDGNWPIKEIINDLAVQGGLAGVIIKGDYDMEPDEYRGGLTPSGNMFIMYWNPGKYFRLIMVDKEEALVEAFDKILGYRFLCEYRDPKGGTNVEWEKTELQKRAQFLRGLPNIYDLKFFR